MEDDMWCVSSSGSSRSYRSETAAKYQSGPYLDLEEFDEDGDIAVDYPCPFCSDDYDLVELCRHIDDEHYQEDNNGTCPVCSKRVKMHMVNHITTHHRDVLKSEQKEMSYREDPYSSDKYFQSPHDEFPPFMNQHHTSKSVVSDKFLSFINNTPLPNQTELVQSDSSVEDKNLIKDSSAAKEGKSSSPLLDSEQLEKAKKCQFVQGLLSSAMFDDGCDFF
ncbi:PREDICTED: protein DEHYDRATION-INDUCED 19 homolog 2-like [Camelina sativa]|uniref:Protein DEHYDRATION-INDUCED 19 homolog 2-like n=1 Tax=Camelina sativa TaxID=90675 RepID=A0ABM0VJP9_CAMSA|nr:PREDICTED: protein DEHYDRATION-INDUCED 19 homolog 2-like [Camelina sativa]